MTTSAQRKEDDLVRPIHLLARRIKQEHFVDDVADGHSVSDEYPRHRLAGANAVVGVARNGSLVVREQDAVVRSGPRENRWVIGGRESDVLNANEIELGPSGEETVGRVAVEVLVRE